MKETQLSELHYVYIVRCANNCLYTGYTKQIEHRVALHNAGKGGRYTRAHRPVELIAFWQLATKRAAMQVEYQIKQLSRKQKLEIAIGSEIPQWLCWHEAVVTELLPYQ